MAHEWKNQRIERYVVALLRLLLFRRVRFINRLRTKMPHYCKWHSDPPHAYIRILRRIRFDMAIKHIESEQKFIVRLSSCPIGELVVSVWAMCESTCECQSNV